MNDHPLYNGDYIAQAIDEINSFSLLLDTSLKLKRNGEEFRPVERIFMDHNDWPTYNFNYFQKYTNEKLSSSNPLIYIPDLDEILISVDQCISKYCQLIEKTISETENFYLAFSKWNQESIDSSFYIYHLQVNFCFQFVKYYKRKRNLILKNQSPNGDITDRSDYILDKGIVIELLAPALVGANNHTIDFIVSHILYLKYQNLNLIEKYPVFKFKISQNELCKRLGKLRTKLNFGPESRKILAEFFSQIPQTENNGTYTYLTYESLHRGMNDPQGG